MTHKKSKSLQSKTQHNLLLLRSGQNDYTLAYYVNDGFLVLTCLIVLLLHVQKHQEVEKTSKAIRKIFSFPALILFGILAMTGFMFGARDSLYAIYLQDELGADTQLISEKTYEHNFEIKYSTVRFSPSNIETAFLLWLFCLRPSCQVLEKLW